LIDSTDVTTKSDEYKFNVWCRNVIRSKRRELNSGSNAIYLDLNKTIIDALEGTNVEIEPPRRKDDNGGR
jgi:hypothetical protein